MTIEKEQESIAFLQQTIAAINPVAVVALFSGGHDSLCSTNICAQATPFLAPFLVAHINTGIGIEATREFVRRTCQTHEWNLQEMFPDSKTYEQLVLEKGFPHGPASHNSMYYYLKQRQVRRLVKQLKTKRSDKVLLVTGIRKSESNRRMARGISVPIRKEGAAIWCCPILGWDKFDCNNYIQRQGLERNQVSDLLHRSGECLCGAFANKDEIKEIDYWYPQDAARIHALEMRVREQGLMDDRWAAPSKGAGKKWPEFQGERPMCVGCE